MTRLTIQIPDDVAQGLKAEAAKRDVPFEQVAVERLISASPESGTKPVRSYASYFVAAKGQPGAYGSVEAIDRYITELQNEW